MNNKPVAGGKRVFMDGNQVVAWGALAAGADIMCGYPITPQNKIMHHWARLAVRFERKFLQTEDELSAGFAVAGGVLAGRKAFSATAGPGSVLMQEPLSLLAWDFLTAAMTGGADGSHCSPCPEN